MKNELQLKGMLKIFFLFFLFHLICVGTYAQNAQAIRGVVTDNMNEPLIGASVLEKGTANGTITNIDGQFNLTVSADAVLIVSYMGYEAKEITVGNQTNFILKLGEDQNLLDEVVVVGYGVQKKAHLTGAVSAVDGKELTKRKSASVLASMQGALPGVSVTRGGGRPGGEDASITIRGMSSVNSADALVLIDGIEGSLTTLNPDDIESISVLKDAAASAIYGARAAAGVVLVTTKKGVSGKAKVTYNGSFGINTPTYMPKRLPAWEEQNFINMSRINQSINSETGLPTGNREMDAERDSWIGNPNYWYRPNGTRWEILGSTNWIDEGMDDYGYTQNHSVSVNGGSEKTQYYLSGGIYQNNGIMKYGPDDNNRVNLRFTFNTELSKYLSADIQVSYQSDKEKESSYGSGNIVNALYSSRGRQTIYQPGEHINYAENPYNGDLQVNAIDLMKNSGFAKKQTEYFTGKIGFKVKNIVKGLTLDVNASRRAIYYNHELNKRALKWYGKDGTTVRSNNGNSTVTKTKYNAYQDKLEALLNYSLKIDKHSFHVLGGASYEQYLKDEIKATAQNLLSNDFFSFNFYDNSEAANTTISDLIAPWKMASLFGRIDYNYAERYLFEAVVRYDGSSRLAPGKRWDVFPSVSLGWRISEEAFFKERLGEYVSNLKLRASWGELGNSSAINSYFPYWGLITNKNNNKNDNTTKTMTVLGNPAYWQSIMVSNDLTWEILESKNIGVDLGLFNNQLNVGFEYYWKKNKNMMTDLKVGSIVGVDTPYQNAGELKTWGWEFNVSWNHKIGDVSYQVGFNIDDPKNELKSFAGANVITEGLVKTLEGYPINSIWGYKTDGYWSSRQEYLDYKSAHKGYESFNDGFVTGGDVKYVAQGDADHTIGEKDLVYLGNTNPRYLYGINLAVQWKGFDFAVDFQGVGKRSFLLDASVIAPLYYSYQMPWTIHRDYWTEDNPNAFFPRIININGNKDLGMNYRTSDKWVQNGAYIRLKNIQLGYTIPISKKYIENLRVYVAGTDVWEHSKVLSVYDPETKNAAGRNIYPFFRTWTTGVNITF